MPPWFADSNYGHISNDRSLKQAEIDRIAAWVDAGAPEGDPKDAPAAVKWPEGWVIQPDIILDGPVTDIPADPKNNVFEWMTVTIPSNFTENKGVCALRDLPVSKRRLQKKDSRGGRRANVFFVPAYGPC
jgi:hypothetical protein